MRVTLCKFCDFACLIDGGKGAVIGMFDTIGSRVFPMTHTAFHVCVEFEFDPSEAGTYPVEVALVDDDGRSLVGVAQEVLVERPPIGRNTRVLQSILIENLEFHRPGTYRLDVKIQGRTMAQERLYVLEQT